MPQNFPSVVQQMATWPPGTIVCLHPRDVARWGPYLFNMCYVMGHVPVVGSMTRRHGASVTTTNVNRPAPGNPAPALRIRRQYLPDDVEENARPEGLPDLPRRSTNELVNNAVAEYKDIAKVVGNACCTICATEPYGLLWEHFLQTRLLDILIRDHQYGISLGANQKSVRLEKLEDDAYTKKSDAPPAANNRVDNGITRIPDITLYSPRPACIELKSAPETDTRPLGNSDWQKDIRGIPVLSLEDATLNDLSVLYDNPLVAIFAGISRDMDAMVAPFLEYMTNVNRHAKLFRKRVSLRPEFPVIRGQDDNDADARSRCVLLVTCFDLCAVDASWEQLRN